MMHEFGHALGLKHGHQDYTFVDLRFYLDPGGASVRYGSPALPAAHDGQSWSLMTYRSNPGASITFQGDRFNQPQTYMQDDIAALQFMYGANFTTNSTNSTYTFSTTTGQMFIEGVGQTAPTGNIIYRAIWDGGGIDTYNLSNYSTNLTIDLSPGAFSNFGMQVANNRAYSGGTAFAPGNIANALLFNGDLRSLIENVIGGSGNDTITGNVADNALSGGAGNDTLNGGAGNDVLDGAIGVDTMIGGTGNDTYLVDNGNDVVSESASAGNDTVYAAINYTLGANVENSCSDRRRDKRYWQYPR